MQQPMRGRPVGMKRDYLPWALMAVSIGCLVVDGGPLRLTLGLAGLALSVLTLFRSRPRQHVPAADDVVASARVAAATVKVHEQEQEQAQERTEPAALGARIDALLSMNRELTDRTSGHFGAAPQASGKFRLHPGTSDPAAPGRLLLVDDDPAILRTFARVLKAEKHDVVTAASGTEAIKRLGEGEFDVVVSDIAMPDMDGIALLREVRRRDLVVPVVLATGHPDVKTAAQAVEIGAFQYLIKPIRNESLCQVVGQAIRVGRIARVQREAAQLLGQGAAAGGDRAGLEVSFDRALESLWIAYQPIVDVRARSIYAFESLLRSREAALPHPGAVLDAAERLGRLDGLGRLIRAKAAAEVSAEAAVPALFVNLHVRDLLDPDLLSPEAPLSKIASRVVLEITERSSLEDVRDARSRVAALREMGFRIAVDDMGAGYAGLSSFALLEPDVVKLDMSLIRDVHKSATKQRVVRSMTELSKGMGMVVVAEGVETADERDVLLELGCDLLQGYLFAKPAAGFPGVSFGEPALAAALR
jgi:EAL domain-containing protein (putative c-di-GMP-specific phosphodiesterase class I)/ActR/RegA family two-component response regulator